jgi:hypothetical protein
MKTQKYNIYDMVSQTYLVRFCSVGTYAIWKQKQAGSLAMTMAEIQEKMLTTPMLIGCVFMDSYEMEVA